MGEFSCPECVYITDTEVKLSIHFGKMHKELLPKPKPIGRPSVMTEETIGKLEEVFAIGGTDEEACFYADICKQALYDYQERNPSYVDRKEQLKQKPFLKARQTIVKSLDQPDYAFEYMKRKKKDEFSDKTTIEHEGEVTINFTKELRERNKKYEPKPIDTTKIQSPDVEIMDGRSEPLQDTTGTD